MLLVFQTVFSVPVISWIKEVGGWVGGRGGGGWEAEGRLKQPFRLEEQCCAFKIQYKKEAKTREEQFGTPCSPINATQDHEMHPRGFTALIKSRLEKQTWQFI